MKLRAGTWLVIILVAAALAGALIALKYRVFTPQPGPMTSTQP